ncbi:Kunitz/Bovine pancreatic trypsin inhibitor domain protein [Oesophagostomum dentatum]|uniref:Kunitz/Bovine pancreatic trypsin inhibitor domain protein n=1 Tax=Oesophagostomum dentatum TaxID=61180 RepID=A0A0B1S4I8_OESDE|nr:Kunitz/Bovine pancreatic trypsin inhibitor domain protein [Oesophagostomum dentatum]
MGKEEKHDKISEDLTIVERRKPKSPSFGIKFGTKKILPFKDDVTVKIFTAVPKIFINQDRTSGPKLVKFEPIDKSNPCHAPIKTGRCKAAHKRYGYDAKLGKCVSFIYGGCGGNKNNFETMLECKKTCEASAPLDIRI